LQFLILGPLEVRDGERIVPLGGAKQRATLAILLLYRNEVVSRDFLVDGLWGASPPASATHTLETYVSRLRTALRMVGHADRLVTRPPGYMLRVEDDELDLQRLEALMDQGDRSLAGDEPELAAAALCEGLALFRGDPLEDLYHAPFAHAEIGRLDDLRLAALEQRIEADLAVGGGEGLIGELKGLVTKHPLRERFWGQLMLAEYRSGRQGEALATFDHVRRELSAELGIAPGYALQQLHQQMLQQEPSLLAVHRNSLVEAPGDVDEEGDLARDTPSSIHSARRHRKRWIAVTAATVAVLGSAIAFLIATEEPGPPSLASRTSANSVAVFDLRTHRLVADVDIHDAADALSYGYGAVWAETDGGLKKIDVNTLKVTDIAIGVNYLALGAGAAWVSIGDPARIVRIDPTYGTQRTLKLPRSGFPAGPSPNPGGLVVADGSLWVAQGGQVVRRIDPTTDHVTHTFAVPGAEQLAADDSGVYVASEASGEVRRIDPASNRVAWTGHVHAQINSISAAGGFVWVTTASHPTVTKLDASTGIETSRVVTGEGTQSVAAGDGAVLVSNPRAGTVSRIDTSTNKVTRFPVAHAPFAMAANGDHLWVSLWPSPADELQAAGVTGPVARISLPGNDLEGSAEPAMIWSLIGQQIEYATEAKLYNYPDQGGVAGATAVPEVAAAMPVTAADGRSVTIRVRSGYRFSPGSQRGANTPVTAATFRSTIERAFSPGLSGNGYRLLPQLVGGRAYAEGRADRLAGVTAHGDLLRLRFLRPVPDLPQILAEPIFSAVPEGTPHTWIFYPSSPSAGPYYLSPALAPIAWQLILKRNPNYHGPRPHSLDAIVDDLNLQTTTAAEQALHGPIDVVFDPLGQALSPTGELARQYAVVQPGRPRYLHVPWRELEFLRLNTRRGPLRDASIRRAINFALDRPALAAIDGSIPTDHYVPPGMPGVQRDRHVYPIAAPDPTRARALMRGRTAQLTLLTCTSAQCQQRASIVRNNLASIGIGVRSRGVADVSSAGNRYDIVDDSWQADEYDPQSMLGLAMFRQAGYRGPASFSNAIWHRRVMQAAALDSQHGRFAAFEGLELRLMRDAAPWAAYAQPAEDVLLSARMGCVVENPVYGLDLAALCRGAGHEADG
jgi:DNA-binding SARP family transcriptional activator/ABC-type oligopeptide transport system substrate-binding subunit